MRKATPSDHAAPSRVRTTTLALLATGLAAFAFTQSYASATSRINPVSAHDLAPWDGNVGAKAAFVVYATQLSAHSAQPGRRIPPPGEGAVLRARAAYLNEPLNPTAVAILGAAERMEQRHRIYDAAIKLSRRDSLLHAKILEDQVATGDLTGAVKTLHAVMKVKTSARDQILNQFAFFLQQPGSVDAFYELLKDRPDWTDQFLIRAAAEPQALDNLKILRRKLPTELASREADLAMVKALIANRDFEDAYLFYRRLSENTFFEVPSWNSEFPPLDWHLAKSQGLDAQVEGSSNALSIAIDPMRSGTIAFRLFPAPKESLRMTTNVAGGNNVEDGLVSSKIMCSDTRKVLSEATLKSGELTMAVPSATSAGCEFLLNQLIAHGSKLRRPMELQLNPIEFTAAR